MNYIICFVKNINWHITLTKTCRIGMKLMRNCKWAWRSFNKSCNINIVVVLRNRNAVLNSRCKRWIFTFTQKIPTDKYVLRCMVGISNNIKSIAWTCLTFCFGFFIVFIIGKISTCSGCQTRVFAAVITILCIINFTVLIIVTAEVGAERTAESIQSVSIFNYRMSSNIEVIFRIIPTTVISVRIFILIRFSFDRVITLNSLFISNLNRNTVSAGVLKCLIRLCVWTCAQFFVTCRICFCIGKNICIIVIEKRWWRNYINKWIFCYTACVNIRLINRPTSCIVTKICLFITVRDYSPRIFLSVNGRSVNFLIIKVDLVAIEVGKIFPTICI